MKYPFPIKANKLILTQGFRAENQVDFSTALSTSTSFHNGVDVVCGTPEETWGKECTWPFPFPGTVWDAQVDSPLGAKLHCHSQIDGTDPATGIMYSLIYIHLSAVTKTKAFDENIVITYNQGDVIGRVGNNGAVLPAPTPQYPLLGTHLHLGIGVKKPGEINYLMVDPLIYFDLGTPPEVPIASYKFNNTLTFNTHNPENTELQRTLQKLGFFPATQFLTDYYGPITATAVLKFRAAKSVSSATDPLGHSAGPLTRAALNAI